MTTVTRADLADMLGARAFGEYLRRLREEPRQGNGKPRLRQRDVVDRLRAAFGLRTTDKDLFEYETGKRRPNARTKAALMHVLEGDSAQADNLLLYPQLQAPSLLDHAEAPLSAEALAALLEGAVLVGAQEADSCIESRHMAALARAASSLSPERQAGLQRLMEAVEAQGDDLADQLLRYGRFMLTEQ